MKTFFAMFLAFRHVTKQTCTFSSCKPMLYICNDLANHVFSVTFLLIGAASLHLLAELTPFPQHHSCAFCRLLRNRQSAALHRERQRALVEGLYGRVEALRTERDSLRREILRVQKSGVSVALPPSAILPPLVPDCDLEAGVDPDGLDSASQLTAIIRSSKTLALPPQLTAPVAAPAQARGQLSSKAAPSPKHSWHTTAVQSQTTAPGSVRSASAASDPASGKGGAGKGRSTHAGSSSDDDVASSVAGSERSQDRPLAMQGPSMSVSLNADSVVIKTQSGQAITLDRSDVMLASQYATRDALGEDTLEYTFGDSGSEYDSDDDISLAAHAIGGSSVGAALLALATDSDADTDDEGHGLGADVHSHAKAQQSFSVDSSLAPIHSSPHGSAAHSGSGSSSSGSGSFFTSTLALCAMVAVLSGPTLLQGSGGESDLHELAASALAHLGDFAGSAGSLVQTALASPGTVPFLSGLGALLHSNAMERSTVESEHEVQHISTSPHTSAADAAASVPSVQVQPAAVPSSHVGASRTLSALPEASELQEGHEDKMAAHVLQLGAEQQAHVMAVMTMLKPVFAEGPSNHSSHGQQHAHTTSNRLRGHKQARPGKVAGVSVSDWMEFNNESGRTVSGVSHDHSVLTSLPLLHAPRVASSNAAGRTASTSAKAAHSKGLVPYSQQFPPTALLPDSSGSISRLQLFRLGLMYGTLHGIEAASAGDWGQVVPSWSIVEASAVQQLAVLLSSSGSRPDQAADVPVEAWRMLARASLQLRPQVDEALQGLSSVSEGNKQHASASGSGVLTDLMLGHAGGNATQELLQQAAAVLQH